MSKRIPSALTPEEVYVKYKSDPWYSAEHWYHTEIDPEYGDLTIRGGRATVFLGPADAIDLANWILRIYGETQ